MKIKEIQVEGFGVWKGLTLESLSHDVNVFYGENEAGKTTLMHFVRSMMFGPSPDRQEKYLPPLHGGPAGGTVAIHSSHGAHQLRRQFDQPNGEVTAAVTVTDLERGSTRGQGQLTEILSEMDETIFNNVFTIGLREIQELNALNSTQASELLYKLTSGMDRVSLVDVMRDWQTKREAIFSSTANHTSLLLEAQTKKQNLLREIGDLEKTSLRWDQLRSEKDSIAHELDELGIQHETLEREARVLEIAIEIDERWHARVSLQEQVDAIGSLPNLDDLKTDHLDELNCQGKSIGEKILELKQRRRDTKSEAVGLPVNRRLLTHRKRIEALAAHTPWIESLSRNADRLGQEVEEMETGMVEEIAGLGNHLQIRTEVVRKLEKRRLSKLKNVARNLSKRQKDLKQIQSDVETAEFEQMQLLERFGTPSATGIGQGSLEETANRVAGLRRCRELKQKMDRLKLSRRGLEGDIDDIVQQQALPVSKLVILGVVFVLGTVLAGFGFLDWINAGTYLGQGPSHTGFLLMVIGAVCGFVSFGMKHHWEKMARESLEDFRHQTEALRQQLGRTQSEWEEVQNQFPPSTTDFKTELTHAENRLRQLEEMAPLEKQLRTLQTELQQRQRDEASRQVEVETAREQWQSELRLAGLPDSLQPNQVREVLQRSGRIGTTLFRLDGLRQEWQAKQKELKPIQTQVQSLLMDCGLEFNNVGVLELLGHLEAAIVQQRSLAQQKKRLIDQHRGLGQQLAELRSEMQACREKKEQLFSRVGARSDEEFHGFREQHASREGLREQHGHLTQQIAAALGAHFTEQEVAPWLTPGGTDSNQQHWEQLQEKIETVRQRQTELHQQSGELSLELKLLAEDSRLDEARLELNTLDAQIDQHKQQWRILATGTQVLESIREEYESKRQPESLQEASTYLQRLTGGHYQRIWTRMVGKELLCDTADNQTITVDKLSRGTREAVYLSLRLALVGAYARRGKVLPMVLDDVLVNFDARRAQAAAELLCEFSRQGYQLLIFTCHQHIAAMFHELQANVKTLPHHAEVAEIDATATDYKVPQVVEQSQPWASRPTVDQLTPGNQRFELTPGSIDPELEYELLAIQNDEQAENRRHHEWVHEFLGNPAQFDAWETETDQAEPRRATG
ncbi:MAG: AAA family ATPase [Mariniblastus sp.]|nr:AAA family ATPase [Mariniblastus sp.]